MIVPASHGFRGDHCVDNRLFGGLEKRIDLEIYPELKGPTGPGAFGARERAEGYRMERKAVVGRDTTDLHVRNFTECVRARSRPAADAEIGHQAATAAHLGNIAFRTCRKIRWDSAKEEIVDDPEASRLLGRAARKPWDLI